MNKPHLYFDARDYPVADEIRRRQAEEGISVMQALELIRYSLHIEEARYRESPKEREAYVISIDGMLENKYDNENYTIISDVVNRYALEELKKELGLLASV